MAPKRKDKLSSLMNSNMSELVGSDSKQSKTSTTHGKEGKVAEQYFNLLKKHQHDLNKDRVTLMMQVGSFYEVYGYINEATGERFGNLWDVASDAELSIAAKKMVVFGNPDNQLYMAGVKEEYVNRYIDKLVDKQGWTIIVYEQVKENGKHIRQLKNIISPGINFDNDNISNVFMYLYIKSFKNRLSVNGNSQSVNYGVYYVDCISGNSGVQELYSKNSQNISVELSELLKIITIQNPKEIVIHLDLYDAESVSQLSKSDLYTNLSLYSRNVKFISGSVNPKYESLPLQRYLLENVYSSYKTNGDILVNLELVEQEYARYAICLGVDYIKLHNSEIINNLTHLEVGHSRQEYLMLANNCLYQLDILNENTKFNGGRNNGYNSNSSYNSNGNNDDGIRNRLGEMNNIRKITLLDILNNTKTVIGSRIMRNRISMPITSVDELEARYNMIDMWLEVQNKYILHERDNNIALSPLNKVRNVLSSIKDIPKYMRKMATGIMKPNELNTFINSCKSVSELYNLVEMNNLIIKGVEYPIEEFNNIVKELDTTFLMEYCSLYWCNIEHNIFVEGFDSKADELQSNVNLNENILNLIINELTKFISGFTKVNGVDIDKFKYDIKTLGKYGKHIYINTELYNFLCNEKFITDNNKLIIKSGSTNREIIIKDLEYTFHKKGYYVLKCGLIDHAARSLTADIENLTSHVKQLFINWQRVFFDNVKDVFENMVSFVGMCDINQCCVYNANKYNHSRPVINTSAETAFFRAEKIRHPLVEVINPNGYISNDLQLGVGTEQNGILLYGPNAAGKSTLSKAIGINIIMAQAGMYVPASEFEFKPYNYIFTRIKNNDNLHAGLSSFQVEMRELKVIMDYCDENSIVLGDEILNSTNSLDATAIMSSALISLHNRGCQFMFATHLHFLTQLDKVNELERLKMYHMGIRQNPDNLGEIIYERKMRPGSGPKSYAILISKSMNLDSEFIDMAFDIRRDIEEGRCLSVSGTLEGEAELIQWDSSKYNKEKIVDRCQVCTAAAVDVHHINEQNCAGGVSGYITTGEDSFHKNRLNNLVSLCKSCHQAVHASPTRLIINGYSETTGGWKLNWVRVDEPPAYEETVSCASSDTSSGIQSDNEVNISTNITINNELDEDELAVLIRGMRSEGKKVKSIQYALRKQYGLKMKLIDIERY
jgi:DNA mismatch repair protein MutS